MKKIVGIALAIIMCMGAAFAKDTVKVLKPNEIGKVLSKNKKENICFVIESKIKLGTNNDYSIIIEELEKNEIPYSGHYYEHGDGGNLDKRIDVEKKYTIKLYYSDRNEESGSEFGPDYEDRGYFIRDIEGLMSNQVYRDKLKAEKNEVQSKLYEYITTNNLEGVENAITLGIDVLQLFPTDKEDEKVSTLELVIKSDNADMLNLIFKTGKLSNYYNLTEYYTEYIKKYNALKCADFIIANFNSIGDINEFNLVDFALQIDNKDLFERIINKFGHADQNQIIGLCLSYKKNDYINVIITNKFNPETSTALVYAAYYDNLDVAKMLIEAGVNIDEAGNIYVGNKIKYDSRHERDWYGDEIFEGSPLNAAVFGKNYEMMKYLVTQGAKMNSTTIDYSILTNSSKYLSYWLSVIGRINEYTINEKLAIAVKNNSFDVISVLIKNGADPNGHNLTGIGIDTGSGWDSCTLLGYAASQGFIDTMKVLLLSGVDVNSIAPYTSLSIASSQGQLESIKFLMEHGADINITDGSGNKAINYAKNAETRSLLRSYMK